MKKKLIYLAAPYTFNGKHEGHVVLERVLKINYIAGWMFQNGYLVFSPISHTHPIFQSVPSLGGGWEVWKEYDERMIACCDELWIFTLSGWSFSKGVKAEVEIARQLGKPVKFIDEMGNIIEEPANV